MSTGTVALPNPQFLAANHPAPDFANPESIFVQLKIDHLLFTNLEPLKKIIEQYATVFPTANRLNTIPGLPHYFGIDWFAILNSECPFYPGLKVHQSHAWVVFTEGTNLETMKKTRSIRQLPEVANVVFKSSIRSSCIGLITIVPIPNSKNTTLQNRVGLLEKANGKIPNNTPMYLIPTLLEVLQFMTQFPKVLYEEGVRCASHVGKNDVVVMGTQKEIQVTHDRGQNKYGMPAIRNWHLWRGS